ncbi:neutral/alkaline non-lysosomal ceramidase N-terminal domain-containing protein [Paenibacillus cymbidii]|uniref:neutral/alkaline non-lysosomal ceramidase N-terminal domain-containing protein n=1 Tax=Paenibacillus cymbidii TaxID=1639034 RepID=UPI0010813B18|nr:neutral/alkaline non-lysosomal ceramidase N-terminal domain-containing protein [Paenibacillus cymbidii]
MVAFRLGIAKADITPPKPIPMAGFAARTGNSVGVARPLYARVWLFEQEGRKALLVQGDLIWWGAERIASMQRKLEADWGIAAEDALFHASHTHGGPQTSDLLNPILGRTDAAYVDYLERQVLQAVAEAHGNIEPVSVEKGTGACEGISINRRKAVNGVMAMAPNPDGVNDTELIVYRFLAAPSRVKGVLFHFACHPTTVGELLFTSEYCGAAMERLDEQWGDGVSCFLQGYCGDIRPPLVRDGAFYRGTEEDVARNGGILAQAVLDIAAQPMRALQPAPFFSSRLTATLPYERVPQEAELEPADGDSAATALWKAFLRDRPELRKPAAALTLHGLKLADGLAFLAMDGEIVVEYGLHVKRLSGGGVLPLGYTGGMVGYVPTAQQIAEGGYESKDSAPLFGLPAPFSPQIEEELRARIGELIARM